MRKRIYSLLTLLLLGVYFYVQKIRKTNFLLHEIEELSISFSSSFLIFLIIYITSLLLFVIISSYLLLLIKLNKQTFLEKHYFCFSSIKKKSNQKILFIISLAFTGSGLLSLKNHFIFPILANLLWEILIIFILLKFFSKKDLGLFLKNFYPHRILTIYGGFLLTFVFLALLNYLILGKREEINPVVPLFLLKKNPLLEFLLALQIIFLGPFSEEILFRGFIFSWLRTKFTPFLSASLISLIFSTLHFLPSQFLPIYALSMLLCFIYERTHNLTNCIFLHAFHNFLVFIPLLFLKFFAIH
ncbi:MAG: hypothetical protein B6D55_00780 [Candidatus Omnitrophica bacterium 4484_70.2]|nr:MAG: hypothetical protein B6D55_00780 [Candidatus Omnitrophica bacterium 4484_70.2]